jgi:hypothetical protein
MHAVVVRVSVQDVEQATEGLRNNVVPQVKQAPGFVAGYWTRSGNNGLAMLVFESEDAARQAADRVPQSIEQQPVTLDDVEVREVVANA